MRESGVDLDINQTIKELEEEMLEAANNLEFEKAALLRDQIRELKRPFGQTAGGSARAPVGRAPGAVSYRRGRGRIVKQ
jgi:excinuclease ABC subunit B